MSGFVNNKYGYRAIRSLEFEDSIESVYCFTIYLLCVSPTGFVSPLTIAGKIILPVIESLFFSNLVRFYFQILFVGKDYRGNRLGTS